MWNFFLYKMKQMIPIDRTTRVQTILATIYAFTAWNLTILTFYYSIKDEIPNTPEKKEKFMKKMQRTNLDIEFIEVKGISLNSSKNKESETNNIVTT